MVRLKITAQGQVTLTREILDGLGVACGDEVDIDVDWKGRASIRAVKEKLPIENLYGILKREGGPSYSIEEINEAIEAGWAGGGRS